jgi:hypothetical protein
MEVFWLLRNKRMLEEEAGTKRKHALLIVAMIALIQAYNSARFSSKLIRQGLQQPRFSSWTHLYQHGDDGSFVTITGFDRRTFETVKDVLFPPQVIDISVGQKRGRPSGLDEAGKLGLYLLYCGSRCHLKFLCMIFGVIPTTASNIINNMMYLVCRKLQDHPFSRVFYPSPAEMAAWAALVQAREPSVNNNCGFVDGVKLPVQCSDDEVEQNAAYCGYHHDTMCNNVFAFRPLGKIFFAAINYPGSWHDATVCQDLVNWAITFLRTYCLCVDQGFPRSGDLKGKFVGPLSRKSRLKLSPILANSLLRRHALYCTLL